MNEEARQRGQQEYLRILREEMEHDDDPYIDRQLRRHRIARTVVIVFGAAVPVLAAWDAVPRVVLGLVGAVAAVAEGIAQLFQFQSSAINKMAERNAKERELNLFLMCAGPYAQEQSFPAFAERIERIRDRTDQAFIETWRKTSAPAQQQANGSPNPDASA